MLRILAAITLLLVLTNAVAVQAGPGYIALDLEKRILGPNGELLRRDDPLASVDALLTQNTNRLEYLINITVGTPPQVSSILEGVHAPLLT